MSNSTTLGLYDSPHKLLETIAEVVSVPSSLKVTYILTGILNEGQENERAWANLTAVNTELYEKFESIGEEQHCPTFKVKLKGYKGEDLSQLQDVEISFESYELAFVTDKFKQPIGLALVLELANIAVN